MSTLLGDLKQSLRRIKRTPGFAAIVVLTLALGIGANTAILSVVDAVLLRPLPYRQPDRLITINHFYQSAALDNLLAPVSAIGFRDYRDKTTSFESMAVETGWNANLTGAGDPERVPAGRVSGLFFTVYGVPAEAGRVFGVDEDTPGKNRVVVISDRLWRRVYGGNRDVVGKTVELNALPFTIVGVMPPGFRDFFNATIDIWTPLALPAAAFDPNAYTNEYLNLSARLRPGVTVARAAAEMRNVAERLRGVYPNTLGPEWTLKVRSLDEVATGKIRPVLLILLGAVGFVLLIACANVANLLLARAAGRVKEVAIRSALGAERWTLMRQLLTESVVLALAGGVLGLGVAYWSITSLAAIVPNVPDPGDVRLDGTVLAFTFGVAIMTGVLFGLVPALQTSRVTLADTLKEGGRSGSADVSGRAARRVLVVAEMALALVLLTGAGLLIKSVARLESVHPGFDPRNLLTFGVALPQARYPDDTVRTQFFDQAIASLAAVPGVRAVAATSVLPFGGSWSTSSFSIAGDTPGPNQPGPWGDIRIVNADFFQAMHIPLLRGRSFTTADRRGAPMVAVVDAEFVKRYATDRDPLGRKITFGAAPGQRADSITIVGVVGHTMHEGLDADPRLQVYLPYAQTRNVSNLAFAVRTGDDPMREVAAARAAIRAVDHDMPISRIRVMDDLIEQSMGQRRLSMILLGSFAAIAILLAAIGIYGVMSHSVSQRTRELGIRMALGAARPRVMAMVIGQGMALSVAGLALGLAGAYGVTRLLSSQLYAVKATDPATFGTVAAGLAAISLLAVIVPALRATRVDPVVALREE
ncbi:MAG TPA: ABC transporter permease [Gemmatimonadaceae bacterium]|nr:ABC transporter permease [Gemmatimonadaceae bacterium]